jgi:hypothetical protein
VVRALETGHGIRVRGAYDARDLAHVQEFARLYRPYETRGLTFDFASVRVSSGRLGEWLPDGTARIMSRRLDTVLHEGAHHVMEFAGNARTRTLAELIVAATLAAGRGGVPAACVTRPYALEGRHPGDHGELLAELLTGLAGLERGLLLETTLANPAFDPPEPVRRLVRCVWSARSSRSRSSS